MRLAVYSVPCIALALLAGGCGEKITDANIQVLNDELEAAERSGGKVAPKEVESILGYPEKVETFQIPLETRKPVIDGVRYFYEQNGRTLELHFVDGRLINRVPKWSEQAKPATSEADRRPDAP